MRPNPRRLALVVLALAFCAPALPASAGDPQKCVIVPTVQIGTTHTNVYSFCVPWPA